MDFIYYNNLIRDVMISVVVSIAVDGDFHLYSGQTTDYEIGIFFCPSNNPELRREKSMFAS